MPSTQLLKRDWEKDHVYLVQFPRTAAIPTPSPFTLKLETWLRMNDIPYTNIDNQFSKKSAKGQIPFIELNGRQIPDSNIIIDHLIEHFDKGHADKNLSAADKAISRAFFTLIEHHICWTMFYSRSRDCSWLATEQGFLKHLSGIKAFAFKNIMVGQLEKKLKKKCGSHGIGLLTKEEVIADTKKDLEALSVQLGEKKYLFGDVPTTLDATAFGHLSEIYYAPLFTDELNNYMDSSTPNLVKYLNRIKEIYWPDWEEACTTQSLNTKFK
ncbi:unnamed protein product [Caenorhabditis bovis]|uniref:Uncharacterized protein n=1 Tax=Caenorhabditis bovis TaxID=2654633 RepID=A0A8S1F1Q2_9PELO|nr:unnamed protein product [Caenorhabditis bovis]